MMLARTIYAIRSVSNRSFVYHPHEISHTCAGRLEIKISATTLFVAGSMMERLSPAPFVWTIRSLERSGLEWQHLVPCMHRVCVICTIKAHGKEGALDLFREQMKRLAPVLDQCQRNPPQATSVPPLHVEHMATLELAESLISDEVHPVLIAQAVSMFVIKLTSAHYDLMFVLAILASSCADIERGEYNVVKKTH
jgi:hypothetical protein